MLIEPIQSLVFPKESPPLAIVAKMPATAMQSMFESRAFLLALTSQYFAHGVDIQSVIVHPLARHGRFLLALGVTRINLSSDDIFAVEKSNGEPKR